MSRSYAQLCTLVFAVVAVGGWFMGTADNVVNGVAQGNLGSLTLHMTYARDILDLLLLLGFVYAGFLAGRSAGKWTVMGAGVVLLLLGIFGFINGDDTAASKSVAGLDFAGIVNVFDTVFGALAILSALGTLSDSDVAAHENKSFLREG